MRVRDYRHDDFPTLCAIDRLCFPPGVAYPPQELDWWIKQRGAFVIVAEDGEDDKDDAERIVAENDAERIVGFVLARALPRAKGHIITIDMLPEYRCRGAATALMEQAHARLKDGGSATVELETSVENTAAQGLFYRLGYQKASRIPRYYLDRIDAWRMVKKL